MQFKLAQYCPVYLRIPCALSGTAWSSIWCFCNCWRTSRVPPSINNLTIRKYLYLKKKLLVSIVADYADTRLSNFALAYLRENKKVRDTVVACSYGAQVESFKQKNGRKSRNTVPLKILYIYTFIHYLYTFWRTFSLHHTVCQLCI